MELNKLEKFYVHINTETINWAYDTYSYIAEKELSDDEIIKKFLNDELTFVERDSNHFDGAEETGAYELQPELVTFKSKGYKRPITIEDLDKAYLAGVNGENYIEFIEKLKLNE